MILQIDFESHIPIYQQLKRQIIEGIAKGYVNVDRRIGSVINSNLIPIIIILITVLINILVNYIYYFDLNNNPIYNISFFPK